MNWIAVGIGITVGFVILLVILHAIGKGCDRAIRHDEEDRFR